jgi:serine/threonine-protein kinase
MASRAVEPGAELRGKYRVERVLGAGGMGVVVEATHLRLGQLVAIKLLRAEMRDKQDVVLRFAREARTAATLRGEHAVRILDVDDSESGDPFLVMEYLEGNDLGRELAARGPLPLALAVDYVLQVCEGIAEAHASGIVHRDLKPSNLFLTTRSDGTPLVKILDFGISKAIEPETHDALITAPATALGSPAYMSPEQLRSAVSVDARADIWALGVILYQLATNALPFDSEPTAALIARIAADPPRPFPEGFPTDLADVIRTCLEKTPERRYADVTLLARALAPFATGGEAMADRVARAIVTRPPRGTRDGVRSVTAPPTASPDARPETRSVELRSDLNERTDSTSSDSDEDVDDDVRAPAQQRRRPRLPQVLLALIVGGGLIAGVALVLHRRAPQTGPPNGTAAASGARPPRAAVCPTYLVAGDAHTCLRRADGSLVCWGDNRFGQLGTGDTQKHGAPTPVAFGGLGALKVYAPMGNGEISSDLTAFTCALASDENFWCWGDNRFGQLGTGDTESASKPVLVRGIDGRVAKATNGAGNTCVQTNDGSLYCWGRNLQGQLGTGDTRLQLRPAKIEVGAPIERLGAGGDFTCVRGTDAALRCWGANTRGQLGIGTTDPQLRPTAVKVLGKRVGRFAAGGAHACVFTEDDGQVWCWGDNRSGQLGTGDTERRLVPTEIDRGGLGRVKVNQIFAGGTHTCALRDDNTLWCWGGNRYGQLGTGDTEPRLVPTEVHHQVSAAYAGGAHTCVIKKDGSVWCWGNNQYGQLGVESGPESTKPVEVLGPCQ